MMKNREVFPVPAGDFPLFSRARTRHTRYRIGTLRRERHVPRCLPGKENRGCDQTPRRGRRGGVLLSLMAKECCQ